MIHDSIAMIHSADIYLGSTHYPAKRCFVCPKCLRDIEGNGASTAIPVCCGPQEHISWMFPKEEAYMPFAKQFTEAM